MKKLLMLMVCTLFLGCVNEQEFDIPDPDIGKNLITLSFTGLEQVKTRSGTSPQGEGESEIHTCYVVVFQNSGNVIFEKVVLDNIKDDEGGDFTKKQIILPISIFEQILTGDRIHIILNPTGDNYTVSGLTEANILQHFEMNGSRAGYAYVGSGIPMYGIVTKGAGTIQVPIRSSVAKMQVKLAQTVSGGADFNFTNPTSIKYTLAQNVRESYLDGTSVAVTSTDPATTHSNTIDRQWAIAFDSDNYERALYPYPFPCATRAISTGEPITLTDTDFNYRRTCILLYNSDPGVPANKGRYYRLDLYKDGKYIDLKNNTHYIINITAVKNWGYLTATEALMHPSSNVEFDLVSIGDKLYSNGQYGLSVRENQIKTSISLIHHPLLGVDNNGNPVGGAPAGQSETLDLTTLTRIQGSGAPMESTTRMDVTFTATKIGTTGNITAQLIEVVNGTESNVANPLVNGEVEFDRQLGNATYRLRVKFSGVGQMRYSYNIKLGNIEYSSESFNYTSGYQYNSNERQRLFDLGREMPADMKWSGGTSTLQSAGKYYLTFPEDNSRAVYWRIKLSNGDFNDDAKSTDAYSAPVFRNKELVGVGFDTKIRIIQAHPFYIGRYDGSGNFTNQATGTHMCVASYNAYENIQYQYTSQGTPSRGGTFNWTQARNHCANWAGDGLTENTGWQLPTYAGASSNQQMYKMYEIIFHYTDNRGGSANSAYKWWNEPYVNFSADKTTRWNFLPLVFNSTDGYYWSSSPDGGRYYLLYVDAWYASSIYGTPSNAYAVRAVRAVR